MSARVAINGRHEARTRDDHGAAIVSQRWSSQTISRGAARRSTPRFGSAPFRTGAWRVGSILVATAFMQVPRSHLALWWVPPALIYTEVFGSGESSMPGIVDCDHRLPHFPIGLLGTVPLVSFARSNLSLHWHPKFQSLLELAEACDVPLRWSCRTGVCRRCESAYLLLPPGRLVIDSELDF